MIKLFFDIETLPSSDEDKEMHLEILKKKTHVTGSVQDGKKEHSDVRIHAMTSFEGTFGRICCIGIIKDDEKEVLQKEVFSGSEKEILKKFWKAAENVDRFVGHNIWAFDLPFIYKRSIINGVKPKFLNFARYRNMPIYDTLQEWELWNFGKAQSLDTLAKVLSLKSSKDEMDGSMVYKYYKDGRIDDICRYCMKDVVLTRQVYYKMTFEQMPEEEIKETLF